ncbi:conserved hypothetical protein [Ricinus communis]|uniref:Uncharacterized protein n=1 Tax=Ricinus communis TaxID=3988 RepID=B9REA9_RICCO|nr:conserved hypothetical protein [Ricinus communis]
MTNHSQFRQALFPAKDPTAGLPVIIPHSYFGLESNAKGRAQGFVLPINNRSAMILGSEQANLALFLPEFECKALIHHERQHFWPPSNTFSAKGLSIYC